MKLQGGWFLKGNAAALFLLVSVSGEDPEIETDSVIDRVGDADGEGPVMGEGFAGGDVEVEPEAAVSGVVREGDRWMDHFVDRDGVSGCGDGHFSGGGQG